MSEKNVFNLDRELNISNNVDANGRKWEIKRQRGRAFYFTKATPARDDLTTPGYMSGVWTNPTLLQKQITKYVTETWDRADEAKVKADRKAQAKKENQKEAVV